MAPDDDAPPPTPAETAADASAGSGSDLRGKDLLTRSAAELDELERQLAPAVRAEYESWFARPSIALAPEPTDAKPAAVFLGFGDGMDEQLAAEAEERRKRVEAAAQVIAPWMYDMLERHDRKAHAHRTLVPPAPVLDPSILKVVVPSPEEMASIGEPRAYERSRDIDAALEESAPQAILRDLYRPESEFTLQLVADDVTDQMIDGHAAVLEALAWRPEPFQAVDTVADGRTAQAEFRTILAQPWAESVPAATERRRGRKS